MIPKRWRVTAAALLATGVLATGVAFAATGPASAEKLSPGMQETMTQIRELRKSRMEQLRTDVQALIDKAQAEGKITPEQADKLKAHPKGMGRHGHHPNFKGKAMTQEQLKAKLDEAVKSGRLTQEQADKMLQRWESHQKSQSKAN